MPGGAAAGAGRQQPSFPPGRHFLDPYLAVAVLHKALKETTTEAGTNLRRRTSIVVRSGALRNLHDLIFALRHGGRCALPLSDVGAGRDPGGGRNEPLLGACQGAGEGDLHHGDPRDRRLRQVFRLHRPLQPSGRHLRDPQFLRLRARGADPGAAGGGKPLAQRRGAQPGETAGAGPVPPLPAHLEDGRAGGEDGRELRRPVPADPAAGGGQPAGDPPPGRPPLPGGADRRPGRGRHDGGEPRPADPLLAP